jgi:hypothetical protein
LTCLHCGTPIPPGSRRDRRYCDRNCSALASYYRRKAGIGQPPRWQHPALEADNLLLRAAAEHARQLGQEHGWSTSTIRCAIDGLTALLSDLPAGGRVRSSQARARIPRKAPIRRVTEMLADLDLLDDDTTRPSGPGSTAAPNSSLPASPTRSVPGCSRCSTVPMWRPCRAWPPRLTRAHRCPAGSAACSVS